MPGLPRSIIKKYGVTKKAWAVFRSGRHRRVSSPSRSRLTMPRRRRRHAMAGRPRRFARFRRHLSGKRFPMSVGIGLATSVLASPGAGWGSAMNQIQAGQPTEALQSFIRAWTGVRIGGIGGQTNTEIDIFKTLNPFDMSEAPAWKVMLLSALTMKAIKMLTHQDPISKIPFINKYAKFS